MAGKDGRRWIGRASVFTSSLALAQFLSRFGPICCFFIANGEVDHIKQDLFTG